MLGIGAGLLTGMAMDQLRPGFVRGMESIDYEYEGSYQRVMGEIKGEFVSDNRGYLDLGAFEGGSKTNFDNEIPRSGAEWNEYLKGKYGADNVGWNFNSIEDIINDPTRLKGYTASELEKVLGSEWTRDVYGSAGGGWKFLKGDVSIFYHPGGGRHGGSYYGISTATTGKIKVVNPDTYIPLPGDKATIIYEKR